MRRLTLILVFAPLLHAVTFRFDPPVPTNDTTTMLTYSGSWGSACPPVSANVWIDGQRITLGFSSSCAFAPAAVTWFSTTVNLGLLPAGVYDVVVPRDLSDPDDLRGSTKLVVRDATTFTISPIAGPISGGTHLILSSRNALFVEPLHILIDGVEVPVVRHISDWNVEVATPPHAAGAADVVVQSSNFKFTAKAAFSFYDLNAATPNPFVFTPLLFPLDFAGRGAFGSDWTTETWLETSDGKRRLPVTGSASGVVVPVLRSDKVSANSRIRDRSRSVLNAGIEVPVVRETDFADRLRLLNIPTGENMRALLRIWTTDEPVDFVYVNIDQLPTLVALRPEMKPAQNGLRFGTFDLTPFLNSANDHLDMSVSAIAGTRIWGMVSITNNDTQQVTIISPSKQP